MNIVREAKYFKKYCEPYGKRMDTAIEIINSGYTGNILYNTTCKQYIEFWKMLQENKDKLAKEIRIIYQVLEGRETTEEKSRFLSKKLNEHKIFQRAAAQYLLFFGMAINLDKHLQELRDLTYSVRWSNQEVEQFIQENDSYDTLFKITPSVHDNITDAKFVDMLRGLKGSLVIDYFYSPRLLEIYKDFSIIYTYDNNKIDALSMKITKGI